MNHIMKPLFALILLGCSCRVTYAQKLETAESEYEMAAGQTSSFVVSLKEGKADKYNALTFSILMPEGISLNSNPLLTNKMENPFCVTEEGVVIPTDLSQMESIMFYALGDFDQTRRIKMAIASACPLADTEVDDLLTFGIKTEENLAPDLYLIKLQNILFEYEPKEKDKVSDASAHIRVRKLGDTNRDEAVNTADATLVINDIMDKPSSVEHNVMLADMNDDKEIDIFDIMKLINVILYGKLPNKNNAPQRAAENRLYEDMTLAFSGNGVTIGIPDAQRFTSFQFEVELPENIELTAANLIGASSNHIIQFAKIEDNYYRVMGLSMDNSLLNGNNGNELIGLEIPKCGKANIHNAIFVTPQGVITYFNDIDLEDGITSVRRIMSTNDDQSVYDLLGRKVQTKDGHLPKGIYIINNKRVVIK